MQGLKQRACRADGCKPVEVSLLPEMAGQHKDHGNAAVNTVTLPG
jgi:hypothetical protein